MKYSTITPILVEALKEGERRWREAAARDELRIDDLKNEVAQLWTAIDRLAVSCKDETE